MVEVKAEAVGPARERTRSGSGPNTPNRKGKGAGDMAPASPGTTGWNNRAQKASLVNKSVNNTEKIKENAADGAWVREKLPPAVQDKA